MDRVTTMVGCFACGLILLVLLLHAPPALSAEKTIGVIMTGDISYYREAHNAFLLRLGKEGYAERVKTIVQRPYPDPFSLSNAARKLIALDVDVIVSYGTPATLAVFAEKTKIPLVYSGVCGPFNIEKRGKNVTGLCSKVSPSSLLRYLRGITPITTLAVIYSVNEEDSVYQMKELKKLAEQYGFGVEAISLTRHQGARERLSGRKFDAIFITSSSIVNMALSSIMDFSRDQRIPTATLLPDRGSYATVSLSASPREQGEMVADRVLKILSGTPPEMIRTDSSVGTELVFNLREARESGFRIPMDLVTGATKLIE